MSAMRYVGPGTDDDDSLWMRMRPDQGLRNNAESTTRAVLQRLRQGSLTGLLEEIRNRPRRFSSHYRATLVDSIGPRPPPGRNQGLLGERYLNSSDRVLFWASMRSTVPDRTNLPAKKKDRRPIAPIETALIATSHVLGKRLGGEESDDAGQP
jgi:hypothetical protein